MNLLKTRSKEDACNHEPSEPFVSLTVGGHARLDTPSPIYTHPLLHCSVSWSFGDNVSLTVDWKIDSGDNVSGECAIRVFRKANECWGRFATDSSTQVKPTKKKKE